MRLMTPILAVFALIAAQIPVYALDNGVAQTPPMGWNSWNKFGCDVSEKLIRETADAMVRSGMRDVGYQYIIVDDCWQVARSADGTLVADPLRFPSGMKALADYVHARGLKFGLYSAAGDRTCQGRPGSRGHEAQDARSFAQWGVDYLKYDWCTFEKMDAPRAYTKMRDALLATGRPILFSICEWGQSKPASWAATVGNMWRTTGDIADAFDREAMKGPPPGQPGGTLPPPPGMAGLPAGAPRLPPGTVLPEMGLGVLQILDRQAGLARFAGPGGWNDPDMLEVGNGGMTDDEYRGHFALWAILGAPLIAGNDVRNMDAKTHAILTNAAVIRVSQDRAGKAGDRLARIGDADIWGRRLENGGLATALLNRGTTSMEIRIDAKLLGLASGTWKLRDLWNDRDFGTLGDFRAFVVAPHSALMLTIIPDG